MLNRNLEFFEYNDVVIIKVFVHQVKFEIYADIVKLRIYAL